MTVVSKYDNNGKEFADVAGMTSMIPGTPGQTITGTLEFREYAYTTNTATPTLTPAEPPKAHYVARCIATGTGYTDSDPSSVSFVTGGESRPLYFLLPPFSPPELSYPLVLFPARFLAFTFAGRSAPKSALLPR